MDVVGKYILENNLEVPGLKYSAFWCRWFGEPQLIAHYCLFTPFSTSQHRFCMVLPVNDLERCEYAIAKEIKVCYRPIEELGVSARRRQFIFYYYSPSTVFEGFLISNERQKVFH